MMDDQCRNIRAGGTGRRTLLGIGGAVLMAPLVARGAHAAPAADTVKSVRIAFGNGLAYLPFYVGRKQGLFASALAAAGFAGVSVEWPKISGTAALNDSMLSGSIDLDVAGTPGLLLIWDRTRGRANAILGCAGVTTMPLLMVTLTDRIRTLADFTAKDRIAMPSSVGTEATMLRMACVETFGKGQQGRLDSNLVSLSHPDAVTALLNGIVTAYVGSPPYTEFVLSHPKARAALRSPDVFKGKTSFVLLCARKAFAEQNPRITAALAAALGKANAFIAGNPAEAAQIYVEQAPSKIFTAPLIEQILKDPEMAYTTQPFGVERIGQFMASVGQIQKAPTGWQEVFVSSAPTSLPHTQSY
jgi:NitT/TauT family transport system substrate-binding protein